MWFSLAAEQGDPDAGKKRDEVAGQDGPRIAGRGRRTCWRSSRSPSLILPQTRSPRRLAAGTPGAAPLDPDATRAGRRAIADAAIEWTRAGGQPTLACRSRGPDITLRRLPREDDMDPEPAGASPRLRLRLIGLTDLHANLLPYDYYRDRPDDSVGLARAASLIAQARSGSAKLPAVRQRRHSSGHAARRLRRRPLTQGSARRPSRDRGDELARLRRGDAWQSRVQLRPQGSRARLRRRAFPVV